MIGYSTQASNWYALHWGLVSFVLELDITFILASIKSELGSAQQHSGHSPVQQRQQLPGYQQSAECSAHNVLFVFAEMKAVVLKCWNVDHLDAIAKWTFWIKALEMCWSWSLGRGSQTLIFLKQCTVLNIETSYKTQEWSLILIFSRDLLQSLSFTLVE